MAEGLVEPTGQGTWTITQAGQTLSSATAAKRVTRATAEEALQEFIGRVERVNRERYFLGKVTRVVLFGSRLDPKVERVSDVDLAVEIVEKEANSDRARKANYDRVEELAAAGHKFRNAVEMAGCWHLEVFRFLKGRSRVIALADYAAEKSFVLAVPHRFLIGKPEQMAAQNPRARESARAGRGVRTIAHFEKITEPSAFLGRNTFDCLNHPKSRVRLEGVGPRKKCSY